MNPLTEITRRTFLKTSATAASATALGVGCQTRPKSAAVTATAATLAAVTPVHAAGSDVIKVGMIGCGGRNSGAIVEALTADKGARLVAMCDIFLDRIQDKLTHIRTAKPDQVQVDSDHCFTGFDGYKQVIEASDVVLIANAAKFHPLHAKAAIEAGKHVFVEKPHGIDPYGIKQLQQACELACTKKLSIVSGLHSRYHAGYAETVKRIHDGEIGEVIAIEENFLRAPYGITDRQPGLTELEWQCSSQYHFTWLSGDDVPQSLVHNLDRARWVLHEQVPVKCHGLGGRSTMVEGKYGNVFDHHSVIYELESGVRIYAFCRTTTGCYDESSSIILGSKGRASLLNCRIWGQKNWRWQGDCNPYQIEHDRLFAAIRSGNPINNGDYMTRSTLTTIMGQISCYTGKEVTWEEINHSDFAYAPKPEDCRDGMTPPVMPGVSGSYPVYIPGQTKLI
ncbi:MAG: Gfo/Idh/MocA family oxidoreductase [Verrucomicrobiota bacterium]|nr:Gfo/Idh/MocA family oxidoreductase [Limisphaerales bacterium]